MTLPDIDMCHAHLIRHSSWQYNGSWVWAAKLVLFVQIADLASRAKPDMSLSAVASLNLSCFEHFQDWTLKACKANNKNIIGFGKSDRACFGFLPTCQTHTQTHRGANASAISNSSSLVLCDGMPDTPGALRIWDQLGIDAHSGIVLQQNWQLCDEPFASLR